jgi:AcrR family transcriptional regulator
MSSPQPPRRGRPPGVDRDTVLAAAIKVLRDEGPPGLTVRRLAEVVGASRQVVYTQFGSLGGLIDALYHEGFAQLRSSGTPLPAGVTGTDLVVARALDYRRSALARPELYAVMFERPFREYVPSAESRRAALDAFEPLVEAVASTGLPPAAARDLALTVWAALHGLVHLELQGYFSFEPSCEQRLVDLVTRLVDHAH